MKTIHCDKCNVDVPDGREAKLIHLVEKHPDLYERTVLQEYYKLMAEINSVDRSNFSRQELSKYLWELDEPWQQEADK